MQHRRVKACIFCKVHSDDRQPPASALDDWNQTILPTVNVIPCYCARFVLGNTRGPEQEAKKVAPQFT